MARVTLQTIADRLGVSRMTVSNAFSNPDQLSAALREKVLATADELGYAGPDPTGRALATGTASAIGILLTDSLDEAFTDDVATTFLATIARLIEPRGLAMTLLTAGHDAGPARDVALDGALVYSCRPTSPGREWLLRRRLPLVFVDQEPIDAVPAVNVDDRGGAAAAGRHVAALGHRRVALITYLVPGWSPSSAEPPAPRYGRAERERLDGWREGLGRIEPRVLDLEHAAGDDTIRAAVRSLLSAPDRPTAVICFSDLLALHVIAVAHELAIAVPAELSVVGFDDARSARLVTPALTTVRQDVVAKGRHAAELLLAAIDARRNGRSAPAERVLLPTELVVRASTAPAPS